jgi:hypothetical protein
MSVDLAEFSNAILLPHDKLAYAPPGFMRALAITVGPWRLYLQQVTSLWFCRVVRWHLLILRAESALEQAISIVK